MHFFLHVRQVFQVFFLCQMPDWSIESFEFWLYGHLSHSSRFFQIRYISGVYPGNLPCCGISVPLQSPKIYNCHTVSADSSMPVHRSRASAFADLRIRQPAGMPAGDESSLRLDIDAGGKRLDGVAGVIAGCVVFHFNLPFTLVNLLK